VNERLRRCVGRLTFTISFAMMSGFLTVAGSPSSYGPHGSHASSAHPFQPESLTGSSDKEKGSSPKK
jgi:hypothetical protein